MTIRFVKYSASGNTFLIVDETSSPLASDAERSAFARWALDDSQGIGGSDNVLYLGNAGNLSVPHLRPEFDNGLAARCFSFRIFEHDGAETLSCGNGLLSCAAHLHQRHREARFHMVTEIPSGQPRIVSAGVDGLGRRAWVNLGWPRPATPEVLRQHEGSRSELVRIQRLGVPIPRGRGWTKGLPATLQISGFFVFFGEPHLVVLGGHGLPADVEQGVFGTRGGGAKGPTCLDVGDRLVDHVGNWVNAERRDLFPSGVHLDFASRGSRSDEIDYRTYERAINRETEACGTGALAVAYVAAQLGELSAGHARLWPPHSRRRDPRAFLDVTRTRDGWVLASRPRFVYEGSASVSRCTRTGTPRSPYSARQPLAGQPR